MRRVHVPLPARAAALLGGICLVLAGCGGIPKEPFVVAEAADRTPPPPPAVTAEALQTEFTRFTAAHPGEISLAWVPVGATDVQVLGRTTDSDAWSTIKVPIAVAALAATEEGTKAAARRAQMREAIEWSDNDAAVALYRSLGGESASQEAVETVLRAGGDRRTEVNQDETGRTRGFGRTAWRVEDAATYAASLPCTSEAAEVYATMGRIGEDHRWGLGALAAPTHFKGGWGPSDHGYLLRQLGVIDHHGGRTAIAFLVHPADDAHETAATTASALARWITDRLGPSDAGRCAQAAAPPSAG